MSNVKTYLAEHGLTETKYLELLDECQKKVDGTSLLSWDEICRKYDLDYNADSLRKASQLPLVGGVFVNKFHKETNSVPESEEDLVLARRELEIAKRKFYDQRNAWNKQNTSQARVEENLDILARKIEDMKFVPLLEQSFYEVPESDSEKALIVCLSDLHIGECFSNAFGQYDTDIAGQRLDTYFKKVREIAIIHNTHKIYLVSLGDQISGNIHKSIQITNRENVIEQMKIAINLIADFSRKLCETFDEVDYISVTGNHTRLDKKEDALNDERLDDMISWVVCQLMSGYANFRQIANNSGWGTTISQFDVGSLKCVAVHGDMDKNNHNSLHKLIDCLGYKPDIILKGHMHTPSYSEVSGTTIIQSGCLSGTGDEYTVGNRLIGSASQTAVLVSGNDVEGIYNVKL